MESGPAAQHGFHPNMPAQILNYLFSNCKAHPCAGILFLVMQPLKYYKYLIKVFGFNTYPVIIY